MGRKVRTNPAQLRGLESEKKSDQRRGFFLDFPFYRTYQALAVVDTAIPSIFHVYCVINESAAFPRHRSHCLPVTYVLPVNFPNSPHAKPVIRHTECSH